ncbi:hypothetical protein BV25DRAFT_1839995 [Artomyces pyxidatus]|uniref:Uncharacterized protein n=1 Tax=Artomyces pyxidatus TaxID=48021 RepID=A0ACB8SVS9_9AGAM|nr:hypothetical protein BV25DRAFT_1839995 [Artomyces pyxidatus]
MDFHQDTAEFLETRFADYMSAFALDYGLEADRPQSPPYPERVGGPHEELLYSESPKLLISNLITTLENGWTQTGQSQKCQLAHWPEHRSLCRKNVALRDVRKTMGPIVAERQRSFHGWCQTNAGHIGVAAIHALEIVKDCQRIDAYVFIVYLEPVQQDAAVPDVPVKRTIKDARAETLKRTHELFGKGFSLECFSRTLSYRPHMMRTLVVDEGLPAPLSFFAIPMDVSGKKQTLIKYRQQWLAELKAKVDN